MKTFIFASDHGGYELKEALKAYIQSRGFEFVDLGPDTGDVSVSYADYGLKLGHYVADHPDTYGIGVCGTGLGISYAVNRVKGIRGARITSIEDAHLAKEHNDANILLFGGRQIPADKATKMIDEFLDTQYEGGRHQARIDGLDK